MYLFRITQNSFDCVEKPQLNQPLPTKGYLGDSVLFDFFFSISNSVLFIQAL